MSGTTSWVTAELGIGLDVGSPPGSREAGAAVLDGVELGLRRNPLRAQLLVSRLLGKHVPAPVAEVLGTGHLLGDLVRDACAGRTPVVVGFAETATALGHAVAAVAGADGHQAPYLHTTRRPAPRGAQLVEFREEHSHATQQGLALLPGGLADAALHADVPLVLVDDEISTGRTAINAIRALHAVRPRSRYVVASLLDSRSEEQHRELDRVAADMGASVASVALLTGTVRTPHDVLERAAALLDRLPDPPAPGGAPVPVTRRTLVLPAGLPTLAAHGWDAGCERLLSDAVGAAAGSLPVHRDARTLVLGDEEFMYLPQRLAAALGGEVRTSTTTRSPAAVVDVPGYPLRTVLRFPATEDPGRTAFAYNVAPSGRPDPGNAPGFDDVVLVSDAPEGGHTDVLLGLLAASARRSVHLVRVRAAGAA
ncbi:phosphoribosyltransferase family protein [Blastococcus sp. TBT05-19]|uniref:phosphoribosyltransferase family protein n=1 Tax=Blastococcus sp. TBT05-19 TaxID=2250581 RepID=UPI001314CEBF|nr:phosphoribosyltransferase family protein [Blastococcus sp. TBT05-19]